MSAPTKSAAEAPHDPIEELAEKLYVAMCARIYSAGGEKPQPRAVAQISFKLAEAFHMTGEHTQRVTDLTVALAVRMGIPESELGLIRRGALLHDIGKMAIPDAILQKPGLLSESERAIIQTHPEKARQIISQISYLTPAIDIPYCHHEKWDGTGYPRRLKGEEIPLAVRIFAVVDVFDALTSDRPYRKAWSKEKALAYLLEQSGKHFYPEAVQAFSEMIQEQKFAQRISNYHDNNHPK